MTPENKNNVEIKPKDPVNIVAKRWLFSEIVPRVMYKTYLDNDARNKIEFARHWLSLHPEYSYVIGQNHQTVDDPIFGGFIAKQIDPKVRRHVFAPVSYSHTTNMEDTAERKTAKLNKLVQSCGVESIPIVQAHQARDPEKYHLKPGEIMENYKSFVRRLREIENSDQSYGCIIMPEGHRSEDGVLGKGESGVMDIVKALQPALVIPLGISSEDHLERDHKNFGKRFNLNIGEITFVDVGSKKGDINEFMTRLAQALPPQMRGQYGNQPL